MSYASLIREVKRGDTIVSMRYRQWLVQHGDDPLPDWVIGRIFKQMLATPRVRNGTFSASSSSQCLRRQELAFLGVQPEFGMAPDARLMNVFNDGKWRHLRWQANLLAAGILDRIEVGLPWPRMRAMGTIDGAGFVPADHPRVSWRNKEFGWELKGVNPFDFKKTADKDKQKDEHLAQVHRYFVQGGFDLYCILYEDKATNTWKEWVIEPDPVLIAEAELEIQELNNAINNNQLHPMLPSCRARMGKVWEQCPYTRSNGVCENAGDWPVP